MVGRGGAAGAEGKGDRRAAVRGHLQKSDHKGTKSVFYSNVVKEKSILERKAKELGA